MRKRRVVSKDGLIDTEVVDLTSLTAEEWRALGPDPGGLEWYLRDAERIWRPHAPPPGTSADDMSLAWYAEQILAWIVRIRHARQRDDLEKVGLGALRLGWLWTEAFWWHGLGREMRLGRRRYRQHQKAGRSSAQKRRERAEQIRSAVEVHAETIRLTHPYSREHSTRWLAAKIARELRCPIGTVRDALSKQHRR